jgi:hypothetical protein
VVYEDLSEQNYENLVSQSNEGKQKNEVQKNEVKNLQIDK